ncbi:MAG TPA: TRIC cation channel family protein [Vicinamibacterales bacterium]|nr:TRIC cation channel family protein [Vicinamibacterales bacterium]
MTTPDEVFRVPLLFDYLAAFCWAMSGALVAVRRRFDITGVFVVALLSATGGGLMRDAIFLQRTPTLLTNPVYLPLIAAATLLVAVFTVPLRKIGREDTLRKFVDLIDAVGTPAFAVIGMQLAQDRGIPLFGVIFIGVVNGVAGGLLRDIVVRDVPTLLRPGQFISLTLLLACAVFLVLTLHYHVNPTPAAWVAVGGFVVVRILAVRFNWQSRPVLDEPGDAPPA